ncbi:DUF1692-domain-containing protein [Hesseltinella vesiculosa]|uniref:DUF1692-domain-containing protein n=1 Tax=Hesseltinella vesiculosa TaxID=101127 RepID=A0A1X2GCI2_9FUNG|nr:DUF1692-domain-containing protein [Hesseltinella vesiculosa]
MFFTLIQLWTYLYPVFESEIVVDGGKMEKLRIHFDISFHHIPCPALHLDVMDDTGEHISNFEHSVYKTRLDENGKVIISDDIQVPSKNDNGQKQSGECGSCYGAAPEEQCCNTCADIRDAYANKGWSFLPGNFEQCAHEKEVEAESTRSREGCRAQGNILVKQLRGNFHFSAGESFSFGSQHVHDIRFGEQYDFAHKIHHLQFGEELGRVYGIRNAKSFKMITPLDGNNFDNKQPNTAYQFYLKIVPTEFDFLNGNSLRTFQYSVSRQERMNNPMLGMQATPGTFFHLDFSPMRVIYREDRPAFSSVLVSICAIVGGIFTVASMVDGILYRTLDKPRPFAKQAM